MIDIGLAGATVGGLLSLLSPCSVMLLPAFIAYAFGSVRQILARTAVFYLGLVASLVPLGVFASVLGGLITANRQVMINVVGALIIVAGVLLLLGVSIPLPGRPAVASTRHAVDRTSIASTFLLGTVYAVAGVCAGPILGSVLLVAGLAAPLYGAALMACYALGMCLPLVVLAVLWGRLGAPAMAWLRPRTVEVRVGRLTWRNSWITIVSGVLTVAVGVLLLATDGTARLAGWLDVGTQFELETGALAAAGTVGNVWFVFGALLVVVAVVLLVNREPADEDRAA
ncbi:MAG: cytochrome c biogenesis CcdA family protein [Brooklawnia sp.]|uniref:cytochrome c biogenesis CcdA family protein n=1 Tax=Brooklawnia sp. TaxID=2699740 RepID=UPI003C78F907